MLFAFLVTLREGFEIALVIAIILSYLARAGHREHFREVWLGVAAAVALTVAAGVLLEFTVAELSGAQQEAFEGFTMLAAVLVLTWMVFWMQRQAASLGRELREQVDVALARGSLWALVALAFTAVMREGIETLLFLFAGSSTADTESALLYWVGGLLGFAVAAVLGYTVYRGAHVLPMRAFFTATGVLVLVLAAGLLSNGIAELQESGLIGVVGGRPWDTYDVLPNTTTLGRFMHTLLGYDPAPSWGQIVLYWAYLLGGVLLFLWRSRSAARRVQARVAQQPSQ